MCVEAGDRPRGRAALLFWCPTGRRIFILSQKLLKVRGGAVRGNYHLSEQLRQKRVCIFILLTKYLIVLTNPIIM